jgi:hypothetical protein
VSPCIDVIVPISKDCSTNRGARSVESRGMYLSSRQILWARSKAWTQGSILFLAHFSNLSRDGLEARETKSVGPFNIGTCAVCSPSHFSQKNLDHPSMPRPGIPCYWGHGQSSINSGAQRILPFDFCMPTPSDKRNAGCITGDFNRVFCGVMDSNCTRWRRPARRMAFAARVSGRHLEYIGYDFGARARHSFIFGCPSSRDRVLDAKHLLPIGHWSVRSKTMSMIVTARSFHADFRGGRL